MEPIDEFGYSEDIPPNEDWQDYSFLIKPEYNINHFIIKGLLVPTPPDTVCIALPQLRLRNIEIIPINYPNYISCPNQEVTLVPSCFDSISANMPPLSVGWNPTLNSTELTPTVTPNHTTTYEPTFELNESSFSVSPNPTVFILPLEVEEQVNNYCTGDCSGSINLNPTSGEVPYIFKIIDSEGVLTVNGNGSFENLCEGEYYIEIRDVNNCVYTNTVDVFGAEIIPTLSSSTLTCFEDQDASINLEVSGGEAPYTFEWSNGETTEDLTDLPAGEYSVTITDNINCSATASIIIEQPEAIIILTDVTLESCVPSGDGAINITIVGGTPDYDVSWISIAGYSNSSSGDNPDVGDIDGLSASDYLCHVIDSDGCPADTRVFLEKAEVDLEVGSLRTMEHNDCGVVYTVVGNDYDDYTYNWKDHNGNFVGDTWLIGGLSSGLYYYTITDVATGCDTIGNLPVDIGEGGNLLDVDVFICEGEFVTLNQGLPNVGFNEFRWSTGETTETITVNSYGEYTVNMYNDQDCFSKVTYIVQPIVANITVKDADKACNPESLRNPTNYVSVPAMTGVSYLWEINVYGTLDNLIDTYTLSGGYSIPITLPNEGLYATVDLLITTISSGCETHSSTIIYRYKEVIDTFTEIQTNEVWDKSYIFLEDVLISHGGTLTIKNSQIEFSSGHGFILENASTQLIIDNSTISNLFCEDLLWKGIYVSGQRSNPHTMEDQPSVILYNSTIEHAKVAVKSFEGGIVKAYESKFQNNNYGIWFDSYSKENQGVSIIKGCTFEINAEGQLFDDLLLEKFIYLDGFESMLIYYNRFQNLDYAIGIEDRGIGIHIFKMNKLFFENNQISRLNHGLKVEGNGFSDILANQFQNNWRSSSFIDVDNLDAKFNRFNDELLRPTNHSYQMSITGCYLPIIAHNDFKNGVTGLYLKGANIETGTGSTDEIFQIYKNTFTGFKMHSNTLNPDLNGYPSSIVNTGVNGTFGSHAEGAEIKCNTFNNYDYAIAVMTGAIKGEQGQYGNDDKAPAGNRFYEMGTEHNRLDGRFFIDITNANTSQYEYWRHTNLECKPELFYTGPENIDVNNSYYTFNPDNTSGSCPDIAVAQSSMMASSQRGTATDILDDETSLTQLFEQKSMAITDLDAEVSTQEEDLWTKVDQGNTELLLSDIQLATDQTYTSLVQDIQTIDSYLSDEAAIEFMDKATDRPLAKTIALLANSPLPTKAKAKIADLDLSDELKAYIDAQQTSLSKRERDEKQIHQLKAQKNRCLKEAVIMAYKDSTDTLITPVIDLLLDQEHWTQKELAYNLLQKEGRVSEAATLLTEMESDLYSLTENQQYHMEDYIALMALEQSLDTLCDSLRQLEIINQQALLENIQNSEFTKGKATANLLLIEAGLKEDKTFIQLPNPNDENRSEKTEQAKPMPYVNLAKIKDLIQVYPNPVDEQLTVEYIMFNGLSANTISIYDMNARLLMNRKITKTMDILELNVSKLPPGSYVIALTKDGAKVNTSKFIVK